MQYLNLPAVWGTLALIGIAVPIIIHLLYRKNRKETDWAAMELLRRALVVRSGQIKLEDFIVLLLRCLTLLLIAAALLRPILKESDSSLLGKERVGMVVAIDASLSMNHGEKPRFETALEEAAKILKTADLGDTVSIVFLNEESETSKVIIRKADYDPAKIETKLTAAKKAGASTQRSGLEANIPLLAELTREMKTGTKEVYIITDAQEADWNGLSSAATDILNQIQIEASLFILPVGSDGEENRSVTSLDYASGPLHSSGVARFEATVRNFGRTDADAGTIEFSQEGKLVSRKTIGQIKAGSSQVIPFFANFDKSGDLSITAKISKDDLTEDNSRHTVVSIRPGVRVLCVSNSEDGSIGAENSGVFYAAHALRLKSGDSETGIQVTSVESNDLTLEDLDDYDIILLADIADLSPEIITRLRGFTESGGGLIVFAGDNVNADRYAERFGTGQDSLLPATIGKKITSEEGGPGWSLASPDSDHPLAAVVKLLPEELINAAKIKSLVEIEPSPGSQVILNVTENNAPLLVSRELGEGSVLLFTTSADRSWNELVVHPVYTMLLQQASTTMTSKPGSRLAKINEQKILRFEGQNPDNLKISKLNPDESKVVEEDSTPVTVAKIPNGFSATIEGKYITDNGIYELSGPDGKVLAAMAANSDPTESDVRVVASGALEETLGSIGATILGISPEKDILNSRKGRELSDFLLILGILFFILQSVLAKIFTNKMSHSETDVATSLQLSNVAAARRT